MSNVKEYKFYRVCQEYLYTNYVKYGGEKKKLKVTVIDGEDPENPPEKIDSTTVVETYDPSKITLPSSYYAKFTETYPFGMKNDMIIASTGKEHSVWTKDLNDDESESAIYVNTDTKKVYYFTHNWRGDIVGIYNGNGDLKATYSYDAWGVPTITQDTSDRQIATINPFRYRSYYYIERAHL